MDSLHSSTLEMRGGSCEDNTFIESCYGIESIREEYTELFSMVFNRLPSAAEHTSRFIFIDTTNGIIYELIIQSMETDVINYMFSLTNESEIFSDLLCSLKLIEMDVDIIMHIYKMDQPFNCLTSINVSIPEYDNEPSVELTVRSGNNINMFSIFYVDYNGMRSHFIVVSKYTDDGESIIYKMKEAWEYNSDKLGLVNHENPVDIREIFKLKLQLEKN